MKISNELPRPLSVYGKLHDIRVQLRMITEPTEANIRWMEYSLEYERAGKARHVVMTEIERKLGQLKNQGRRIHEYTDMELDYIRKNYLHMSDQQIAEQLSRTKSGIQNMRYKMNLRRTMNDPVARRNYNPWTPEQRRYVEENYLKMTDHDMAAHLGRSVSSVQGYRDRYGMYRYRKIQ